MDNLNTHRMASLYEAFPAAEARRIAKRLEFHYTPKHGSWLNMAEIEFSVLSRSCLRQRLPDEEALGREVQALVTERNTAQATINWRFNTHDARTKLHRLYPFDSKHGLSTRGDRDGASLLFPLLPVFPAKAGTPVRSGNGPLHRQPALPVCGRRPLSYLL